MTIQSNSLSEEQLQAQCYQWFHNQFPALRGLLFHIPNGGSRTEREGAKFKAIGVVSGIPDLMLAVPATDGSQMSMMRRIHGLFIEMKADKGKLSEAQIKSHKRLSNAGYDVVVCNSFDAFKELIMGYIQCSPYSDIISK